MGKRLTLAMNRAKYAAIGAAVGAGLGGLFSRNAASTGGGVGALVGAVLGEKRVDAGKFVGRVKERTDSESDEGRRWRIRQRSE